MAFTEEEKIFDDFVKSKGLKHSNQRRETLRIFLETEKHLTAEELHGRVKKKNPSIGVATIYRSLKLFRESGLCRELRLEDGTTVYEHLYGHEHHDHLVCTKCGRLIEVVDKEIEKLQEKLAKREGFTVSGHKLLLYGICGDCSK